MIRKFLKLLRQRDQGAVLVELAIVCPIFTVIIFGVADFALAMYARMEVDDAVDAGVSYVTASGWNVAGVENAVTSATKATAGSPTSITATPAPTNFCGCATASSITSVSCTSTCGSGLAPGSYVNVNAQWSYSLILPWPGITNPINLSASSTVRIE
jgi:Flp pilus assembly protein TadG